MVSTKNRLMLADPWQTGESFGDSCVGLPDPADEVERSPGR